jgi:hypothetical protein
MQRVIKSAALCSFYKKSTFPIISKCHQVANSNSKKFHSLSSNRASARDTKSTLNLLSETYQEKIEIEKTESLKLPQNISEAFFIGYDKLSKNLSGEEDSIALTITDGFRLLIELLSSASSKEELVLVQKLMEMWIRSGRLFTKSKSIMILDSCLLSGREQLAFEMLCNRAVYSLRPDVSHIKALIKYYSQESVAKDDLKFLDCAYQSFILNLYYDVPPTVDSYSLLIASGMYVTDPKGVERSNITWKEMRSFGWNPNAEGYCSIIFRFLKDGKNEMAMDMLNELKMEEFPSSVQKQFLLFLAEACMKQGNFAQAQINLEKAGNLPVDDKLMNMIGSSFWTKSEVLHAQLTSSNK